MKILGVKLIAFGPFTDTHLDFGDQTGGLYVVYGPNEAGKSCALRAIRHLLYGIPTRSIDNFIHPHPKMRIGGVLLRDDGTTFEFIRRKAQMNTLRASDDAAILDDASLKSFLGGIDKNIFTTMFGIDHADLVQGGEAIIQGGGDVGQVLFAAGSGISDLRRIQDTFKAQCDELFLPKGKKRINVGVSKLKKLQKDIREAQLPGQEWARHDAALREALEQKQSVDRQLEDRQRERHRLERIKEALPAIGLRKELLNEFKMCRDAVVLSEDFRDRRLDLLTRLKIAESNEKQSIESLEAIHKALAELHVPKLLENAESVEEIYQDLGSHRKAVKDKSGLAARHSGLLADAKAILKGLRPDLALNQADQLRLVRAQTVRIQELGNQYERLIAQSESIRENKEKLAFHLDQLNTKLAGMQMLKDTGRIRRIIERTLKQGNLEENYQALIREIQEANRAAEITLKKQNLWKGTLESLETLPIPSLETIDSFDKRLDEAESAAAKLISEIDAVERHVVELDGQIEQLRLEQEVPTEDDLHQARVRRDSGWQLVRRVWKGESESGERVAAFVASFPAATSLTQAYEQSVRDADELADRLRREADRVARKATLLADRKMRKTQAERLIARLGTHTAELEAIRTKWIELWKALEISPASPREMRAWVQNQVLLAVRAAEIRQQKAKSGELKERIETFRQELEQGLVELEQAPVREKETLADLLDRSQKMVDQMDQVRMQRQQLMRDISQREAELKEILSRSEQTEQALVQWRSRWTEAIDPLGLNADASPAQILAVLEDLKTLFVKLDEAQVLAKRISGIDRDADDFKAKVARLTSSHAPELSVLEAQQAAAELNARLTSARNIKARQQGFEKQRQQEKDQLDLARKRITKIKAQLAAMCQEADCQSFVDLQAAEELSIRRQNIENRLDQLESQLRKLSGGLTIDEFVGDALSVDPDGIDPALERLTEAIERLTVQKSELDKSIGREENELSKMDGSARAAELAEEAQGLIADLEADVQQYVRVRVAAEVLKKAIESYRDKNQGPILKRSSKLFARITCDSFSGLRVDSNNKGDAVLVGVRSNGKETVGVEGMSDGTADQLYLAIRLASLESYLEKNEAMPFIVDDILIHFDNERAAATLQILAKLARQTQIIFFTHHQHLVELAEAHADRDILFKHTLKI